MTVALLTIGSAYLLAFVGGMWHLSYRLGRLKETVCHLPDQLEIKAELIARRAVNGHEARHHETSARHNVSNWDLP